MAATDKHRADLSGVSETALLTLYSRSTEARRPDAILDDPMAIRLVDSIDYDFTRFGQSRQDMAIRARTFDHVTRRYLQRHPASTVVALAEGLQTSFWRLDDDGARFRWLTVDLPPIVALRRSCCRSPTGSRCAPSRPWTSPGWTWSTRPTACSSRPRAC